jgi:hypothetical protein
MKPSCPERLTPAPIFASIPAELRTRAATQVEASTPDEFDLPTGALWSTGPKRHLTITCRRGRLWITQAGDARDTILEPGACFTPAPHGRIVVQALDASRVRLVAE